MKTKTAIVILNWNGRNHLERFLPSVERHSQGEGVEIVVADNGSDDDSLAYLTAHHPQVRQVKLSKNWGFAEGYNRALAEVEAEYYVLLNSDVEVTADWLTPLVSLMDSSEKIAAVMPKIRSYAEPDMFEYAGAAGGYIDMFGYPFCRGRILQAIERDMGQYDDPREIFWATGACMVVRSNVYWQLGGLDADFFAHQEEIDLCWRMQLGGYTIMVEPASVVYHLGGGTLSSDSPRKVFLNFRNNLAMLYKNLSSDDLWWVMPVRMILDGGSAIVFFAQDKRQQARAVWDAHMEFYKMLPELKRKRKTIQKNKVAEPQHVYRNSVVFNYFTGEKLFSEQGFSEQGFTNK